MSDETVDPAAEGVRGTRFVIAAEWVGLLQSQGPSCADLRFAPGGVAHAFDLERRVVICGADGSRLELFQSDFELDEWIFRCTTCVQRLAEVTGVEQGAMAPAWRERGAAHGVRTRGQHLSAF